MGANKDKGTRHESAVVNYLNKALGNLNADGEITNQLSPYNISRKAQTGARDVGDIWAFPFVVEAKDEAKHDIPGYIRQANKEAGHAKFPYGVAVIKKRNANIKDAYVTMDLETFAKVLWWVREAYEPQ